jgi:anaerobic selenocysteine-containing dehydrogenase
MKIKDDGELNQIERDEQIVVHPTDAARLGLLDAQPVRAVTSRGVTLTGVVSIAESVLPGVVSATTLFGELALAIDASEHPDPVNHIPRLETAPVRIEPL